MKENKKAVAVVGNFKFLRSHANTFISNLRNQGKYQGELLILTSLLTPTFLIKNIKKDINTTVIRLPKIKFDKKTKKRFLSLNTNNQPNRFKTKNFQWFKLNLFHTRLKEWSKIFYLDINLTIHKNLNDVMKISVRDSFLAKADGYPNYDRLLISQFDKTQPEIKQMERTFNLNANNYFQTGLMYFDTSIIYKDMIDDILKIAKEFPISITNEQGILNLHFQNRNGVYKELPEYLGDDIIYYYWIIKNKSILITKQLVEQYK